MTTTLALGTSTGAATGASAPGPGRLTRVEMRKAVDTRAGLWLLVAVGAIAVLAAVLNATLGHPDSHSFTQVSGSVAEFTSILLPVVGILLITSEWSQRTALQTFTLVPRRGRVVLAKLAAGIVIGLIAALVGLVLSVLATAVASHPVGGHPWQNGLAVVGVALLYQGLALLGGMAFGLLFLNSAVAIVLSFVLPVAWGILTGVVNGLQSVQNWLDLNSTEGPLLNNDMTGKHWTQLLVAGIVWIGVPLAVGLWRLFHKEIA